MIKNIGYFVQQTIYWLQKYFGEVTGIFLLLAVVAFVYLYISNKNLRYKFLWPIIILFLLVVNPILYKYVYSRVIYWRLWWMIPFSIIIAAAVVTLIEKIKRVWLKGGILTAVVLLIVIQGNNVFKHGGFSERSNWEKISQETIDVCDILLEKDDTPKAIIHSGINTEVRQYAPEIELMYGREVVGGGFIRNAHKVEYSVYLKLKEKLKDYDYALKIAVEYGYNFIVVSCTTPIEEEILEEYGFDEIEKTEKHIIYYNSSLGD